MLLVLVVFWVVLGADLVSWRVVDWGCCDSGFGLWKREKRCGIFGLEGGVVGWSEVWWVVSAGRMCWLELLLRMERAFVVCNFCGIFVDMRILG